MKRLSLKVNDLTGGRGADVVVEVTGFASVIPLGVKMLRIGGRYLMQGALYPDDNFMLASHDVITKCLTIAGLHNYDSQYLGRALDLVYRSRHRYPYKRLAGPAFPLHRRRRDRRARIAGDARGNATYSETVSNSYR